MKRPRILVTNDDGINAPGIVKLAAAAAKLGEVWVVAPQNQCSGMSQKLTIAEKLVLNKVDFPVDVHMAYSLSGTPTDCVKFAMDLMADERPDFVFSGINNGCNSGFDIAYSGTVGATMEAVQNGVPALAFSVYGEGYFEIADEYLLPIAEKLMAIPYQRGIVWNVNFPKGGLEDFRGILYDRQIAPVHLYKTLFMREPQADGTELITQGVVLTGPEDVDDNTDIHALLHGYVSVGQIKCAVL